MNYHLLIVAIILSYLFGNISPSILLSNYIYKTDIRNHGSGNAGTTNAIRVMGKKVGICVFVLDVLKGMIPTIIGYKFGGQELAYILGIAVVIGHIFPILLKFKGGKGVATSFGASLVINPLFAFISIMVFAIVVFIKKYVSLGSMIGTTTFAVLTTLNGTSYIFSIYSFIFVILIVFAHRSNIKNIIEGTEKKINSKK